MKRDEFHKLFKSPGPVVLPVIHVLDTARTLRNVREVISAGAAGCFLINHDFEQERLLPVIRDVRAAHPALWMGVNFLAVTGRDAFPVLGRLAAEGVAVDAYWADDARIDEHGHNAEAQKIAQVYADSGWDGLYFGGTCFKKQRPVAPEHYADAARHACGFMDVVTTSGVATGEAAEQGKTDRFRAAIGDRALALASGVTPENAATYGDVDCFMVATGINAPGNFYDIDPERLDRLMQVTCALGRGETE
ncbi:adenine phosphoribosyltransferase [uncultured Roseobacter sp.]|uniref:adenine phosphoribosyltransferase n=1 Tax=uncultured Roseobacter sp. TaxID=114847 RepID=UPI00261BCED1|nr:adenine phosphoribosyltransferase [uncultured Roseobacter sp.]